MNTYVQPSCLHAWSRLSLGPSRKHYVCVGFLLCAMLSIGSGGGTVMFCHIKCSRTGTCASGVSMAEAADGSDRTYLAVRAPWSRLSIRTGYHNESSGQNSCRHTNTNTNDKTKTSTETTSHNIQVRPRRELWRLHKCCKQGLWAVFAAQTCSQGNILRRLHVSHCADQF